MTLDEIRAIVEVLIPLRIRSISTLLLSRQRHCTLTSCLNPFENQVYFHGLWAIGGIYLGIAAGLNPFENQVYFHREYQTEDGRTVREVLIPLRIRSISTWTLTRLLRRRL